MAHLFQLSIKNVEVVIMTQNRKSILWIGYSNVGYIPWQKQTESSSSEFLKALRYSERKNNNAYLVDWIQEPTQDDIAYTQCFSYEVKEEGGFGQSLALSNGAKAGCYGFIKIYESSVKHLYIPFGCNNNVEVVFAGLNFDLGFRYEDYQQKMPVFNVTAKKNLSALDNY